jgi:hypothetical protein
VPPLDEPRKPAAALRRLLYSYTSAEGVRWDVHRTEEPATAPCAIAGSFQHTGWRGYCRLATCDGRWGALQHVWVTHCVRYLDSLGVISI